MHMHMHTNMNMDMNTHTHTHTPHTHTHTHTHYTQHITHTHTHTHPHPPTPTHPHTHTCSSWLMSSTLGADNQSGTSYSPFCTHTHRQTDRQTLTVMESGSNYNSSGTLLKGTALHLLPAQQQLPCWWQPFQCQGGTTSQSLQRCLGAALAFTLYGYLLVLALALVQCHKTCTPHNMER